MPTFDGPNLVITLDSGVTLVDFGADVYSAWKEWVLVGDNAKYPPAFFPDGGNPLTPGITQGSYFFIQNGVGWRIRPPEEDITIYVTGNLTPQDSTKPVMVPTLGAFTAAVFGLQPITQSVAELFLLQQETSFNGVVHVDLLNGTPGTKYPVGTASEPSNNMADALIIATRIGVSEFHGRGDLVAAINLDNKTLIGKGSPASINFDGFTANHTKVKDLESSGDMGGSEHVQFDNCSITDVRNVSGVFMYCAFRGITSLVAPEVGQENFIGHSSSLVPGASTPIFDMQNLAMNLQVRDWNGGFELVNCTNSGNNVSLDINSGNVILGASNTAGTIVVRGVGTLTDSTGPGCLVINTMVNPADIVASTTEALLNRDRYVKRDNIVHTASGFTARERWFPTKQDAIDETNVTDTFTVTSLDDGTEQRLQISFDKIRDV